MYCIQIEYQKKRGNLKKSQSKINQKLVNKTYMKKTIKITVDFSSETALCKLKSGVKYSKC